MMVERVIIHALKARRPYGWRAWLARQISVDVGQDRLVIEVDCNTDEGWERATPHHSVVMLPGDSLTISDSTTRLPCPLCIASEFGVTGRFLSLIELLDEPTWIQWCTAVGKAKHIGCADATD